MKNKQPATKVSGSAPTEDRQTAFVAVLDKLLAMQLENTTLKGQLASLTKKNKRMVEQLDLMQDLIDEATDDAEQEYDPEQE
jgi:hypothetical protein